MWWTPNASVARVRFMLVRQARISAALCTLAFCAAAHADSRSIAVLSVSSDEDESIGTNMTAALRSEAAADETLRANATRISLTQMTMAQDCEITDLQCRARIANALSVQLVLYGEVRRTRGGDYEAELHMFSQDGTQVTATRRLPGSDVAQNKLGKHARALLRELRSAPEEEDASAAPPAATVAPDVKPLHEAPADAEAPAKSAGHTSNDWIGYTLLGVAGVSLGLTVLSWTQIGAANDDESLNAYRKAVGSSSSNIADACDEAEKGKGHGVTARVFGEARDACSKGNTFEKLQYVFLASMLVAGGVGTYFLLDNDSASDSSAARLRLQPSIARSSASLHMRLEF